MLFVSHVSSSICRNRSGLLDRYRRTDNVNKVKAQANLDANVRAALLLGLLLMPHNQDQVNIYGSATVLGSS